MLISCRRLTALFLALAILTMANRTFATGSSIYETRSLENTQVNSTNQSESVRLNSYINALKNDFPEVDTDSLRIDFENADIRFGTLVRLQQYYRNIRVLNTAVLLAVNKEDEASFATVAMYTDIDLANQSYLSMDSTSLQLFVRNKWPEAALDSSIYVEPCIYPSALDGDSIDYVYALLVSSAERSPSRYLNWETGDTLALVYEDPYSADVRLRAWYKARVPSDTPDVVWDAPGMGRIITRNPDGSEVESRFDPVTGYCEDMNTGVWGWFYLDVHGENEKIRVYETNDPDDGNIYRIDYDHPYDRDWTDHTQIDGQLLNVDIDAWADGDWDDPVAFYNANAAMRRYMEEFPNIELPYCDIVTSWDDGLHASVTRQNALLTTMWFGRNYGNDHWAQYRDVTFHEYSHVWQSRFFDVYGSMAHPCEEWANLQEGTADFLATCLADDGDHIVTATQNNSDADIYLSLSSPGEYSYANIESIPCVYPHDRGQILSAGLSEMRINMERDGFVPTGWEDANDYCFYLVASSLIAIPHTFQSLVYQLLWLDDFYAAGDNNVWNGTPNGQQMYNSLRVSRQIPDEFNAFIHYNCPDPVQTPQTSSSTSTHPSGTPNVSTIGRQGTYACYVDDNTVKLAWSTDDGQNWRERILNNVNYDPVPISPSLGVRLTSSTPPDRVFVCWNQLNLTTRTYSIERSLAEKGSTECNLSIERLNPWNPGSHYDQATGAAYVVNTATPTLFSGITSGDANRRGVHFRRYSANSPNEVVELNSRVPGSVLHNVTSIAVHDRQWGYSVGPIHVAWIANNQVYYQLGNAATDGEITWDVNAHQLTNDNSTKSSVTIAAAPQISGVVIAWEQSNNTTNHQDIGYCFGNSLEWNTDPIFLTPGTISLGDCADLKSPSLGQMDWEVVGISDGYPRIGLGYAEESDNGPERVYFCGLVINESNQTDESQWHWSQRFYVGNGNSVSISPMTGFGGWDRYPLIYTKPNASNTYDLVYDEMLYTYGLSSPPFILSVHEFDGHDTLTAPVSFTRPVIVRPGGVMVVRVAPCSPTPVISGFYGGGIVVDSGGTLLIQGSLTTPIKLQSLDSTQAWGGITINAGTLSMDYVETRDCDSVCIYTDEPTQVSITNCTLYGNKMATNCPVLRLWGNPEKSQFVANTVVTDVPVGVGFYPWNCDLDFDNVTIQNCGVVNSYIKSVTGNFRDCAFKGRASQYGVMFNVSGNTPNFQCCEFDNVSPQSGYYPYMIYAFMGTAPSFGYTGSTSGASNSFTDSCGYMLYMKGNGVKPVISSKYSGVGGHNDWYQMKPSGKFIVWDSPYPKPLTSYFARGQYWNKGQSVSYFYPSDGSYWDFDVEVKNPWGLCASGTSSIADRGMQRESGLDDFESEYDSLFAVAMGLEIERNYSQSQTIFRAIAGEADEYELVWLAMTHAASNQRFLQDSLDGSWIVPMIDSLSVAGPDSMIYDASLAGSRLKGSHYLSLKQYEPAIDVLADALESALTEADSLLVSIELLNVFVAAGLIEYDGSLDQASVDRVPTQLRVKSHAEAWDKEQKMIARLGEIMGSGEPRQPEPLPKEFRLYQNYPNPFNPTTQIEFDLPESAPVTLKVFNTLGQEVTTLLDATRPAGHHVVMWNGKGASGEDVATGLYVYQIQASGYTDAKKMVLLR